MKKFLNLIIIFIIFLLMYLIQCNFFTWFNIMGIKPNIFVILAVFLGIFLNKKYSFTISILLGLLLDLFIGKLIGINALILGIASLIGNKCGQNFSKESRITIMLIIMSSTFACETISYILQAIVLNMQFVLFQYFKIILIEVLYNTIITIIVYPFFRRAGEILEKNFENNKYTRYF